ncbi:hypothetical protein JCM8208_001547 [Rhodotorula glutinis]
MDLLAQLLGTLCDGILQSCAETRTSLVRDMCGACCTCEAPCCSQEAGWDSLQEPCEDEDDEAAAVGDEATGQGAAGSLAAERAQEQQALVRGARAGYGAVEEQPASRARMDAAAAG